jgi:hypothetical protein
MRSASQFSPLGKKDADLAKPNHDLVLRCILSLGSTGRWPVVRVSLPRTRWRLQALKVAKMHSAGSRMLQASGLCSPELALSAAVLDHPVQIFGQPARNWNKDDFWDFVGMQ